MFSMLLKINPRLEPKDLARLEKQLQSRFTKIAKGFSKGLGNALKGGGVVGLAVGLIDKLLNPLKEVQEAIDRTLDKSGDIVSNSEQFGTTAGKLFKLQQLAASKGVDEDNLAMLISKFQTAVAENNADSTKQTAVSAWKDQKDMASGFFEFLQALQKMDKNQAILVQQQVFGEKQILKLADFLNTDMKEQTKLIGARSGDYYTPFLQKLDKLADQRDNGIARQNLGDMVAKSQAITSGMVSASLKGRQNQLDRENQQIKMYEDLAKVSQSVDQILGVITTGIGLIGKLIGMLEPFIQTVTNGIQKLLASPFMKGVSGLFGRGR